MTIEEKYKKYIAALEILWFSLPNWLDNQRQETCKIYKTIISEAITRVNNTIKDCKQDFYSETEENIEKLENLVLSRFTEYLAKSHKENNSVQECIDDIKSKNKQFILELLQLLINKDFLEKFDGNIENKINSHCEHFANKICKNAVIPQVESLAQDLFQELTTPSQLKGETLSKNYITIGRAILKCKDIPVAMFSSLGMQYPIVLDSEKFNIISYDNNNDEQFSCIRNILSNFLYSILLKELPNVHINIFDGYQEYIKAYDGLLFDESILKDYISRDYSAREFMGKLRKIISEQPTDFGLRKQNSPYAKIEKRIVLVIIPPTLNDNENAEWKEWLNWCASQQQRGIVLFCIAPREFLTSEWIDKRIIKHTTFDLSNPTENTVEDLSPKLSNGWFASRNNVYCSEFDFSYNWATEEESKKRLSYICALRNIIEPPVQDTVGVLKIPFALTSEGEPYIFTYNTEAHAMLIAGASGTRKSTLLQQFILNACSLYSPELLNFYIIDLKGTEFIHHAKLPHVRCAITVDGTILLGLLKKLNSEFERRKRLFNEVGKKYGQTCGDIATYNKLTISDSTFEKLPKIIVIIDEIQFIYDDDNRNADNYNKKLEDKITRFIDSLLKQARAGGIHFIITAVSKNMPNYPITLNHYIRLTSSGDTVSIKLSDERHDDNKSVTLTPVSYPSKEECDETLKQWFNAVKEKHCKFPCEAVSFSNEEQPTIAENFPIFSKLLKNGIKTDNKEISVCAGINLEDIFNLFFIDIKQADRQNFLVAGAKSSACKAFLKMFISSLRLQISKDIKLSFLDYSDELIQADDSKQIRDLGWNYTSNKNEFSKYVKDWSIQANSTSEEQKSWSFLIVNGAERLFEEYKKESKPQFDTFKSVNLVEQAKQATEGIIDKTEMAAAIENKKNAMLKALLQQPGDNIPNKHSANQSIEIRNITPAEICEILFTPPRGSAAKKAVLILLTEDPSTIMTEYSQTLRNTFRCIVFNGNIPENTVHKMLGEESMPVPIVGRFKDFIGGTQKNKDFLPLADFKEVKNNE